MTHDRRRSAKMQSPVQVLRSGRYLRVWYSENGEPLKLTGTIPAALANDASRYGQDLVGDLVDKTLRIAERRRTEARGD